MKRQRLNRHMLFPMLTVIMLLSASHICAQRNFSLFGKDVSVAYAPELHTARSVKATTAMEK